MVMFLANMEVYGSTSDDINFLDHVQQRMLSQTQLQECLNKLNKALA